MNEQKRVDFICSTCKDTLPYSSETVEREKSLELDGCYGLDPFIPQDFSCLNSPGTEIAQETSEASTVS